MSRRPSVAEWSRVGRDLRRLDPERFDRLLDVARQVVDVHTDLLERFPQPPPTWQPARSIASKRWGVPTVVVLVLTVALSACSLYSDDAPPADVDAGATGCLGSREATTQCGAIVSAWCDGPAAACGLDPNLGDCRTFYGRVCPANRTVLAPAELERALVSLRDDWTCAPDDRWILWRPGARGPVALDMMSAWWAP